MMQRIPGLRHLLHLRRRTRFVRLCLAFVPALGVADTNPSQTSSSLPVPVPADVTKPVPGDNKGSASSGSSSVTAKAAASGNPGVSADSASSSTSVSSVDATAGASTYSPPSSIPSKTIPPAVKPAAKTAVAAATPAPATPAPATPAPAAPAPAKPAAPKPAAPALPPTPPPPPDPRTVVQIYDSGRAPDEKASRIDTLLFGDLRKAGTHWANLCSDDVFVRRAYLDLIGTLPTPEQARQFLQDKSADKRSRLVDTLLARDEYADYWTLKWSDLLRVKAEYPINLWPNAAQLYHHWIRDAFRANMPMDKFARALLTANGSNFRVGPVNFYRAMQSKDARSIARTVALTFLGSRIEKWPAERQDAFTLVFSQVGYKATGEWKEEIVFWDPSKVMKPGAQFPDGSIAKLTGERDPREVFCDWLLAPGNRAYARSLANRAWFWLMGRGLVQEPDDLRPDNPPSNPALLDYLTDELVHNGYNLKQLLALIAKSQAYQLSCVPGADNVAASTPFACYSMRRLEAEVLIDAINQVTGGNERYSSPIPEPFTFVPENARSITLHDGSISSPFLEMFGKPPRDSGQELERNNRLTAIQSLHLLNSSHIRRKIEQGPRMGQLLNQNNPRQTLDNLYLAFLSRFPTDEERGLIQTYAKTANLRPRDLANDVAWALVNSDEFLYRH